MLKKLIKLTLKYPIIFANKVCIWIYFKIRNPNSNYNEINPSGKEKILVLSPHVDDETIGAGGVLMKHARKGSKMSLVYLTDGSGSTSHKSKEETISERREEGLQVKESYGFESIYFLDEVDGSLDSDKGSLLEGLKSIVEEEDPDIIYSPFLIDGNNDHIETTKSLSYVLNLLDIDTSIYLYQVNNIIPPELVNGISFLDERSYLGKTNKYKIFKTQWAMGFSVYNLLDKGRAINYGYKGYAEAFVIMDKYELKESLKKFRDSGFDPNKYIQISSEFTLIRSMIKSKKDKKSYTKEIRDIMVKNK